LEIRVGLVANPDTPPFSNRHHPVSCIARSGKRSAQLLTKARILSKADVSEAKRQLEPCDGHDPMFETVSRGVREQKDSIIFMLLIRT
jgi:putative NADH-flavin reductase